MNRTTDLIAKFRNSQEFLIDYYRKLLSKIVASKHLNFYTQLYHQQVLKKVSDPLFFQYFKKRALFGVPFFLKDNFMIKGEKTSGGTKILQNFISSFSATAYELLEAQGAILLGKTVLDELAMGGTGLEAAQGPVQNPVDSSRITGGSSSGSVVATAQKFCVFALGSDTGDSCRLPASYLGVVGFKPTFGLISRYGLIPYSPSLDTVAYFANNVSDLQLVSEVLFHHDPRDFACQKIKLSTEVSLPSLNKIKVLVLGLNDQWAQSKWIDVFRHKVVKKMLDKGIVVKEAKLPNAITENLTFVYQIISFSEALSSQANLTGTNFGFNQADRQQNDFFNLIEKNRDRCFGTELKRRYLLASLFTSEKYQNETYFQAKKMRTYINNHFADLFREFDFVMHVAAPDIAPKIIDINAYKQQRIPKLNVSTLLLIANFGGFPSLILPLTKSKPLSVGFNIFANFNQDFRLLKFARLIEEEVLNEK